MSSDNILNMYGGRVHNDLNRVLDHVDENEPNDLLLYPETKYVDSDGLKAFLSCHNNFNVFSINIQSINAKFNELSLLLHDLSCSNIFLSAICIQETWLNDVHSDDEKRLFSINGYKFISQGHQCSRYGG